VKLSAARRAWDRWQAAAGPWQGWTVCPALLAPEIETVAPRVARARPQVRALVSGIAPLLSEGTLCVVDLDPLIGVQVAARLAPLAHPVLLLPRWPYARAVLPVDRLLGAIITESRRLPRASTRLGSVVFVLDSQRSRAVPGRLPTDPRADNRYHLAAFDLPDLRTLRARGIRRIERIYAAAPS
jgi:hypothetical protein